MTRSSQVQSHSFSFTTRQHLREMMRSNYNTDLIYIMFLMHAPNALNSQNASDATNVQAHSPLDNIFWPWGFWALEANDLNGSCRQTRTCNNFCSQSTSVSIFSCLAACPQDCPRIAHFLAASPATHCHLRASCRTTSPQFLIRLFVWSILGLQIFDFFCRQ